MNLAKRGLALFLTDPSCSWQHSELTPIIQTFFNLSDLWVCSPFFDADAAKIYITLNITFEQ